MNVFINRVKPYNPAGRFQSEAESDALVDKLNVFLAAHGVACRQYDGSVDGYNVLVQDILDVMSEQCRKSEQT